VLGETRWHQYSDQETESEEEETTNHPRNGLLHKYQDIEDEGDNIDHQANTNNARICSSMSFSSGRVQKKPFMMTRCTPASIPYKSLTMIPSK
jgi:hypothetical protein